MPRGVTTYTFLLLLRPNHEAPGLDCPVSVLDGPWSERIPESTERKLYF